MGDYEEAKELATLKAQVGVLLKEADDTEAQQRELFQRLGALERRMSQIVVLALLISLILPVTVEIIHDNIRPYTEARPS